MASSRLLLQRGLKAGGAASTITLVSAWVGEQTTSKNTSRVVSRASSSLLDGVTKATSTTTSTFTTPTTSTTGRSLLRQQQHHPSFWKQQFSTTSASSSSGGGNLSFVEWYEGHLAASPVKTKAITGGILWGIGDVVAQLVPQVAFSDDDNNDKATAATSKNIVYDFPRTGRAVLFGFAFHAPASHVHYNFLEWLTVKANVTGLGIPVFKAIMEQFVYWSWISNSIYHGAMGAMQGMTVDQIYDRIADVLWETQKAQWVFWIPVQLLNFRFVPVRHQLNVVLLTSIVWTALLSAWYPPVEEEEAQPASEGSKKGDTK